MFKDLLVPLSTPPPPTKWSVLNNIFIYKNVSLNKSGASLVELNRKKGKITGTLVLFLAENKVVHITISGCFFRFSSWGNIKLCLSSVPNRTITPLESIAMG